MSFSFPPQLLLHSTNYPGTGGGTEQERVSAVKEELRREREAHTIENAAEQKKETESKLAEHKEEMKVH